VPSAYFNLPLINLRKDYWCYFQNFC